MSIPGIVSKRIGYSNTILLLNGENSVLIDTGVKCNLKAFHNLFKKYNLKPQDIKLIILTHVHFDHTGNLTELKRLTGAKILVHKNEFEYLKRGFMPIPAGVGIYPKFINAVAKKLMPQFVSPQPLVADLVNNDEFDLTEFGIGGKVISTPGHTAGSQSVLVGSSIVAGDTFVNMPGGRIFPPFAENPEIVLKTWEELFKLGITEIYPAHGKKFKVEKAIAAYLKIKQKLELA